MRTRMGRRPGHDSAATATWTSAAAATADAALSNTANNPSPRFSTSTPPCASNAARSSSLCRSRASPSTAPPPNSFRRMVEPSMSVNRNVTVPPGSSVMKNPAGDATCDA